MLFKRTSKKLSNLTGRVLSVILTLTVILSTVTVLGLVTFADSKEQMITISSDGESEANVIIPIASSSLSGENYFRLTFDAKMADSSTKPIVGVLKVAKQATKYGYSAYPDYVENEDDGKSPSDTSSAPDLYCKYDAATKKYTAIIKMSAATKLPDTAGSNYKNVFGAIVIGNTEYGTTSGTKIATTDKNIEFTFAGISLKKLTYSGSSWSETGDNLLPALNTDTVDVGSVYEFDTSRYSVSEIASSTALISVPQGKVKGTNNMLVASADRTESLSTGHSYTYHSEIEPTTHSTGVKGYYTCDCGECNSKKFTKKDQESTVEDAELIIPQATAKMIAVYVNDNTSNVAIPLDIRANVTALQNPALVTGSNTEYPVYARVKFKARVSDGKMPILGVIGTDGKNIASQKDSVDNDDNADDFTAGTPDLYCVYNPADLTYEAVVKFDIKGTAVKGSDFALTIGNCEHDGSNYDTKDNKAAFSFYEPELYIIDPATGNSLSGNILPEVNSYNTKFTNSKGEDIVYTSVVDILNKAPQSDWCRDGKDNTVKAVDIPAKFFANTHNFVLKEKVEPTNKAAGFKSYYYCNCGEADCCFRGKKYLDKGLTEASDAELTIGKLQMITLKGDNKTDVFVPLDIAAAANKAGCAVGSGYVFAELSFTARMLEGKKPIVARIRGSSDQGGDYSYSEPDYVENADELYDSVIENSIGDVKGPDLYCYYDEKSLKYTAVICLRVNQSWSTIANGVHDAIAIGHTEYNGGTPTSESDSSAYFSFCNPQLYLLDPATGNRIESAGNLLPEISSETLNFDKEYTHTANPCKASNNAMTAPKDKWSVLGDKDDVIFGDIEDDYFKYYNFVVHKQVEPTRFDKGTKRYYTCECGDPTCMYNGKKYYDKGITEVTNESDLVLSYKKMITVGSGANNNVFVPLDLKQYMNDKYKASDGYSYVRVSFKARMLDGKKPIISRIRGSSDLGGDYSYSESDYAENNDEKFDGWSDDGNGKWIPDLYCEYNEDTIEYTAIIKIRVGTAWSTVASGVHDAILIGNAEHHGNVYTSESDSSVSFSFCEPTLYFYDLTTKSVDESTGNLMPAICDENLNFDNEYVHTNNPSKESNNIMAAPKEKWSIDGSRNNIKAESIPDNYFKPYKFVYHSEVRPTAGKDGCKAYYTCECSDPECMYKGKKYLDKGVTEVTDAELYLGKTKMITVGGGNYTNVYVPIDVKNFVGANHKDSHGYTYVQLSFTARMLDGKKPIISRVRASADYGGDYSWSEPYYTDNADEVDDTDNPNGFTDESELTARDLYCHYDEDTCKYTAVMAIRVGTSWCTLSNGVHDAVLIGHAEHNGPGFKESDTSVAFSFCDPELYLMDLTTGKPDMSTGNLMPAICDETVNFDKEYKIDNNPCKASNHILSAPKNMWSIDGSKNDVKLEEIPENYFRPYKFVKHNEVRPTTTTTGMRSYYTCECGLGDCMYKDKKYLDKGVTEVTDAQLKLGTTKMILVGENIPGQSKVSNIYVPLDLKDIVKPEHKDQSGYSYVQLSFKARMFSGSVPIVSRMRGSSDQVDASGNPLQGTWSEPSYADNDDHTNDGMENKNDSGTTKGPDLYCKYDEATDRYVAVISLRVGTAWCTLSNGVHDAILIGNSEHNGPGFKDKDFDVSFAFADPELYLLNAADGTVDKSTGNLIPALCEENFNFGKQYEHTTDNPCVLPNHLLSAPKDRWSIDGTNSLISTYEIPEGYFEPADDRSTMLTVNGGSSDSIISTKCNLKSKGTYKVDIDYKEESGGKFNCNFFCLNGANEYIPVSEAGGKVDTPIDNVQGKHFSAVITAPDVATLGTADKNFKIVIGASGGKVTFTNVKVRSLSQNGTYGFNILPNGDFCFASDKSKPAYFTFWNIENNSQLSKVTTSSVPLGMFEDTTPIGAYVGNTTGKLTTDISLKPNKNYVLRFCSKYNNKNTAKPYVELNTSSGKKVLSNTFTNNENDTYNTVYKFKTPADLKSGVNATVGVNIDSSAIDGVFSGFEVYEVTSSGSETGNNLIEDSYLRTAGKLGSNWSVKDGLTTEFKPVSIYYFKILKAKLLMFSGKNSYDTVVDGDHVKYPGCTEAYLEHTATVENGKQYIFTVNYKYASNASGNSKVGPEILGNVSGVGYTAIQTDKFESADDNNDEYKATYIFTASGLSEGSENFKFRFNVIGALTSGYLANAELYEYDGSKTVGEQLISNGDFATGDASEWALSANSGHFFHYVFTEIPDNFFNKKTGPKSKMIIYRGPSDYAQYNQHFMLKPSARYQVVYKEITTAYKVADQLPTLSLYNSTYNRDKDGEYVKKSDGRNVDGSSVPMVNATNGGKITPEKGGIYYKSKDGKIIRFVTGSDIWGAGDGNIILRLVMRSGNAGYWGKVELYEIDDNNNRISENLVLNGDFSCGLACWEKMGDVTSRVVEEPAGFFNGGYKATPKNMIYSNGTLANQTYGNTFSLKPGQTYYFTGNYVNMNAQGLTPEVLYVSANEPGVYKEVKTELYYDPDRYAFELKFTVPEDALASNGLASIKVQLNNKNKGKGYAHSLMLTEDGYYTNLFDKYGIKGLNSNYVLMPYDPNVFVFYYDDSSFDDGDWSGEAVAVAPSSASGYIYDAKGNPLAGIKMMLSSGYTAVTDASGKYVFKNVKPGKYTLYLIDPKTGDKLKCIDVTVGEAKAVMMPMIKYDKKQVNVDGEASSEDVAMIMGLLFDENGKRLSGIPVFIEDNGYAKTDKKGIFRFNHLTNFGKKKIYIYLDDGSKYVFRTVNIEKGKGLKIKLRFVPETDEIPWLIILIAAGAVLVLAIAGTVIFIIASKKKKGKTPPDAPIEPTVPQPVETPQATE